MTKKQIIELLEEMESVLKEAGLIPTLTEAIYRLKGTEEDCEDTSCANLMK